MAVFTSIGTTLGFAAGAKAFTAGVVTVAAAGGAIAAGAKAVGDMTSKKSSAPSAPSAPSAKDTGALAPDEVKKAASKRLFRAGIIATSPTGVGDNNEPLASARLR